MAIYSRAESLSHDELRALQGERLRQCVMRAYGVPFYKQKFDEAGIDPLSIKSIDDITRLPFTVKQDLRDNYPFGLFAVPQKDIARVHASSGTTGKQTVVGYTKHDIEIWSECVARALAATGATPDDLVHIAYGYGLFTGGLGVHYGVEHFGATALPVSTGNTQRQIQLLQDFKAGVICSTPSYAICLGEALQQAGISPDELNLRIGIFGAEPWTEEMRGRIMQLLGIKAYDIYGLSEVCGPGVAFECENMHGLHVNEDYFYPEVLDPDTLEPVPDGTYGELVFTCIGKEALPLIRYRTKDIAALWHDECSCGRHTVRMSKPRGRTDDMLIIRGVNVFPSQVEHVLLTLGLEPNYFIIVDRVHDQDTFEVQIEVGTNFSDSVVELEALRSRVENALQSTLGLHAKVRLMETGRLPRFEGKAKRVEDRRKLID